MKTQTLRKEHYPELLKQISSLPDCMDIAGKLPDDSYKYLCVIGSRSFSQYGHDVCEHLISGLKGHNIAIVSGLAIGIDSLAHESALKANLPTIAFPGSGLGASVLYPPSKRMLAMRIVEAGGALLSSFEKNQPSTLWTFPFRNRLMAGISHATLIIEARHGSGTLLTADYALQFNRDILTVPGNIFSEHSYGPHMLIRQGAIPVSSPEHILEALGITITKTPVTDYSDLTETEQTILRQLSSPAMRDDIIRSLNINVSEANSIISELELKGLIKISGNNLLRI